MAGASLLALLDDIATVLDDVAVLTNSGMFYGIQKGAIATLKLGQDWFETQNEIYAKRKKLIFELATKMNCTFE